MESLFWAPVGVGIIIVLLGLPMLAGKVKPNRLYGFRTKRTLSDEKLWYKANADGGKMMVLWGLIMVIASLFVFKTEFAATSSDDALSLIALAVILVPIVLMVVMSVVKLKKL